MRRILRRTNEAAGPYQMFGELGDVVLFRAAGAKTASELVEESLVADYLEEVPLAYVHGDPFFASAPRLILSFVYGRRFGALDLPSPGAVHAEFGELSAFLHPRLELFAGSVPSGGSGTSGQRFGEGLGLRSPPLLSHALVEDVFTEWQAHVGHVDPLFRFLSAVIARAADLLSAPGVAANVEQASATTFG